MENAKKAMIIGILTPSQHEIGIADLFYGRVIEYCFLRGMNIESASELVCFDSRLPPLGKFELVSSS